MTDLHWAVFALQDIQSAIDPERYDVASSHINDAIAAIIAVDEQDSRNKSNNNAQTESQN